MLSPFRLSPAQLAPPQSVSSFRPQPIVCSSPRPVVGVHAQPFHVPLSPSRLPVVLFRLRCDPALPVVAPVRHVVHSHARFALLPLSRLQVVRLLFAVLRPSSRVPLLPGDSVLPVVTAPASFSLARAGRAPPAPGTSAQRQRYVLPSLAPLGARLPPVSEHSPPQTFGPGREFFAHPPAKVNLKCPCADASSSGLADAGAPRLFQTRSELLVAART